MEIKKGMLISNQQDHLMFIAGFYDDKIVLVSEDPKNDFCMVVSDEEFQELVDEGWFFIT